MKDWKCRFLRTLASTCATPCSTIHCTTPPPASNRDTQSFSMSRCFQNKRPKPRAAIQLQRVRLHPLSLSQRSPPNALPKSFTAVFSTLLAHGTFVQTRPSPHQISLKKANSTMSQSPPLDETDLAVAPGVLTVQQHILHEQQKFPGASGEFSWLLSGITIATKLIQAKVRRAGLSDILGAPDGSVNVQGEVQQKLDVFSNEVLSNCLRLRQSVGVLASEENEEPILVHQDSEDAKYAVIFDPLDGSSNIDVNVSVGTTFSVLRRPEGAELNDPEKWVLQPGRQQVAAGYVVYGSSTMLVYSVGSGVHGFTLEPSIGAYVLSHPNMKMPEKGNYYSVNEAKAAGFPEAYQRYLQRLRSGSIGEYSSRYIGSMVADFHRTLLRGGIFLYPPTATHASGKLRLLYEACPIAFLAEQAGGIAYDNEAPVLDQIPTSIHQRTPLIVGSKQEMEDFIKFMGI